MLANDERNTLPLVLDVSFYKSDFSHSIFRYFKDGVQRKNDFSKLMCLEAETWTHCLSLDPL